MVNAMNARSQLAAQNVGDGIIRAPFGGSISERFVDVGTYVHPDTKVVTMVALDELRLEVAIPETSIAFAKRERTCASASPAIRIARSKGSFVSSQRRSERRPATSSPKQS